MPRLCVYAVAREPSRPLREMYYALLRETLLNPLCMKQFDKFVCINSF